MTVATSDAPTQEDMQLAYKAMVSISNNEPSMARGKEKAKQLKAAHMRRASMLM